MQRKRLSREVESLREEIVSLRRHFHSRPEACFRETETAGFIARYLKNLGLSVTENVAGTGVCALLEGEKPGKTLLYRADMDALEMEEESGLPFRSTRKGFAHSCGHDAHMAVALVAARVLAGRKKELRGSVKFVFQPCEESIPGGALAMIRAGVLENPPIDAVLGLHVWQELPSGAVGITAGPAFASIDLVTLKVRGKGGHGATPQLAVDPILISAHIITALEAVVSRETDPLEKKVLTFGELHAGTACNVIPETAVLRGTLRCFKSELRDRAVLRIGQIGRGIAEAMGGSCEVTIETGQPAVENDPGLAAAVREAAGELIPEEDIHGDILTLGAEDVAYFLQEVPGCYFLLGTSSSEKGLIEGHHSPRFNIDEDALPLGVEIVLRAVEKILSS